jgi:hypothetical protein
MSATSSTRDFEAVTHLFAESKGSIIIATQRGSVSKHVSPRALTVMRSAIDTNSLSNASDLNGWHGIIAAFYANLGNRFFFDRAIADNAFLMVPPARSVAIMSSTGTAYSHFEGQPKPLSELTFDANVTVEPVTGQATVVISQGLLRNSAPGSSPVWNRLLRNAVGRMRDSVVLDILLGDSGTASSGTAGGTAANMMANCRTLFAAIDFNQDSRPYFVADSAVCKFISTIATTTGEAAFPGVDPLGGELLGTPLICSDGAGSGVLALIDASQVAASQGSLQVNVATHASLQMNDNPSTGERTLVSLWQNNMVGLRIEATDFGAAPLSANACAQITGIS